MAKENFIMTLLERIAYINGLKDGLKLDESKDEVKVINAMLEALTELSKAVTCVADVVDDVVEQVSDLEENLSDLEYAVYDDEDCDCCCDDDDCDCDCDDYCDCDDENVFYEVTCPTCGKEINVEEEILLCGETECPGCGEVLEFDFSSLFDEDEDCVCGCGCSDCDDDHCCSDEDAE